jgi:hypothetical protein
MVHGRTESKAMARNSELGRRGRDILFVGTCAAIFLVLAACAIYAVVIRAV